MRITATDKLSVSYLLLYWPVWLPHVTYRGLPDRQAKNLCMRLLRYKAYHGTISRRRNWLIIGSPLKTNNGNWFIKSTIFASLALHSNI